MYLAIRYRSRWDHSTFSIVPALLKKLKFWFSKIGSKVPVKYTLIGMNLNSSQILSSTTFSKFGIPGITSGARS